MKTWPTLYKLDNKGKVRQWNIRAYEIDGNWCYSQSHGIIGGKIQSSETLISAGKNQGRSNATTAQEQCVAEAESLWIERRDRKGYSETVPTEKPFEPMLAKSYDKDGKHIKFPCFVQPKLDGLKCLGKVKNGSVTFWSRQNKQFQVLQHLEEQLSKFPDGIYDGELYLHEATFQDIVGAIKRDESNDLTARIEYWIYDLVDENLSFEDRHAKITDCFRQAYPNYHRLTKKFTEDSPTDELHIKQVETIKCAEEEKISHWHKIATDKGYEGIMLRNANGKYKVGGRSADLQKVKSFLDQEFDIEWATENKGKLVDTCVFNCITKDGARFAVMPEGSEEQRRQYWTDWQSGKIKPGDKLTVKFFSWTTSVPEVPRFPVGKIVRNYEA